MKANRMMMDIGYINWRMMGWLLVVVLLAWFVCGICKMVVKISRNIWIWRMDISRWEHILELVYILKMSMMIVTRLKLFLKKV